MKALLRTLMIGTATTGLLVGAGLAIAGPASASERIGARDSGPGDWAPPGWMVHDWKGWDDDRWDDDSEDWQDVGNPWTQWAAVQSAYDDLVVAVGDAQSAYDDSTSVARLAYAKGIRDEQAAYREARASVKTQVGRLLAWRGYTAAIVDEQRALNKALDRATATLRFDEDAAYELFDLETTDEVIAAGRSSFRGAKTAAETAQTRAQRAAGAAYEEAVDVAVERLASVLTEARTAKAKAAAWTAYRKALAAARSAKAEAIADSRMAYESTVDEATSLLAPGDEDYADEDNPVDCWRWMLDDDWR